MTRGDAGTPTRREGARRALGNAWDRTRRVLLGAGAIAVLLGWTAFWGVVIRLHYLQGDAVDAVATAVVFLVPVLLVAARGAGRVLGNDGRPVRDRLPVGDATTES